MYVLRSKRLFAGSSPKIIGSHLDTPRAIQILDDDAEVVVSGWVLLMDSQADIRIEVIEEKKPPIFARFDQPRPDVIKKFFQEAFEQHPQLSCGFRCKVEPGQSDIEVHLCIDGNRYPLWKIVPFPVSLGESVIKAVWSSYSKDRLHEITWGEAIFMKTLSPHLVKNWIQDPIETFSGDISDVGEKFFLAGERAHFKSFYEEVSSVEFFVQLIGSALEFGECRTRSPVGPGQAVCRESFCLPNGYIALRFVSLGGETFFIIQRYSSVDFLFFPGRELLLVLRGDESFSIGEFLKLIVRNFHSFLKSAKDKKDRRFLGIVAGHFNPYHFYYDVVLGMELLFQRQLLERVPGVVMLEGEDFFSFKELYGFPGYEYVKSWETLNEWAEIGGGFFVRVGAIGRKQPGSLLDQFDSRLVQFARTRMDEETVADLCEARASFPLIWLGIVSEKPSWIEQADAGVALLSKLAEEYPRLGVVFDGWTLPQTPGDIDRIKMSKDKAVVQRICAALPSSMATFSVIGSNSIRKIAFAGAIDAFVAPYSTESLFVDRLAKKPGVTHLSREMYKDSCKFHRHYRSIPVPFDHIQDIPDSKRSVKDPVNYSIRWEVVYELLKDLLRREVATGSWPQGELGERGRLMDVGSEQRTKSHSPRRLFEAIMGNNYSENAAYFWNPLRIFCDLEISGIRLSLAGRGVLNLKAVSLLNTGGQPIEPGILECRRSSFYKGNKRCDGATLLTTKSQGFHSNFEDNPYLEFKFEQKYTISEVRIYNCSGVHASRTSDLRVEAFDASGWRKIYSPPSDAMVHSFFYGKLRELECYLLASEAENPQTPQPWVPSFAASCIQSDLGDVPDTHMPDAGESEKTSLHPGEDFERFALGIVKELTRRKKRFAVEILNALVSLSPYFPVDFALFLALKTSGLILQQKMEEAHALLLTYIDFTTRGKDIFDKIAEINRSFSNCYLGYPLIPGKHSYTKPLRAYPLEIVSSAIDRISVRMVAMGLDLVACYGTLLGIIRDGDFMPHDDDLDIVVYLGELDRDGAHEKMEKISVSLNSIKGMSCFIQKGFSHITCDSKGLLIDIFPIWSEDAGSVIMCMRNMNYVPVNGKVVFPYKKIVFKGMHLTVPARPEAFLEERYGEDWNVVKPFYRE